MKPEPQDIVGVHVTASNCREGVGARERRRPAAHLPAWKGNVFVGGLQTARISRTGHVERIVFNRKDQEQRRESLLTELRKRVREVRQGPDGLLYVLVEDGWAGDTGGETALLRIEPAP